MERIGSAVAERIGRNGSSKTTERENLMPKSRKREYQFQFNPHVHLNKKQQEAVLDWLNSKPEFRRRRPTEREFIKECKRRGSPLRKAGIMEVDVQRAAEAYWRAEAQYILRHVDVVEVDIETNNPVGPPVRAWIDIGRNPDRSISEESYVPTSRVANNPSMRATVLDRAHSDFRAWLARYERYSEFFKEFSQVIKAYRELEQSRQQSRTNGRSRKKASQDRRRTKKQKVAQ